MAVKEKFWKIFKSYVKFQFIPLVLFGTIFSILRELTAINWFKITDPNIFLILQGPLVFWTLVGLSFLYLLKFYKNSWNVKSPIRWKTLFFYGFALFVGLYAASANYLLNLGDLLFYTLNVMQNHKYDTVLKPWPAYVMFFCFFTSQLFQSADKNAVTIFNTKNLQTELIDVLNYLKIRFFNKK